MSPRNLRRKVGVASALTVVAAAALVAAAPSVAAAAPPTSRDASAADAVVTLITGDRALVRYAADGTPSATLASEEDYFTTRDGADLYVVPVSAQSAVDAGALDRELFNVTGLVRAGYDDAHRDDIPVIISGTAPRTFGVTAGLALDSIGATAVSIDKDAKTSTFSALTAPRSGTKIWLDGRVEGYGGLDPATGVPQTGADEVWADGYTGDGVTVAVLDTGIDADHPDLTDRIVGSADFTGGDGPVDNDGHGTHVASTIAGTGDASDGSRAGMAPDADLLIGKVLGFGGGQESWIIAGMQWAVDNGADVVNMSLGSSEPTDCTDPMSRAVDELGSDGTLFVIAAGNAGLPSSVSSPGCADAALTVGAVDSASDTARFSSRGPTLDNRVKPDIAAPGVDILGAYAGSPGDNHYRTMSGTSMASPHVAGAAALLKQARPDWTAPQLKQALTSSVKTDPSDGVYDQGAGELWVPGAVESTVIATSSVSVGEFAWPHDGRESHSETITYTNVGDRKTTLKLSIDGLVGPDGSPVTKNSVFLDRKKVTIAPGESADVTLVVTDRVKNLDASTYGAIGGRVIATGGDVHVTTAFGYLLEGETVELTIKATDRNGDAAALGNVVLFHEDAVAAQQIPITGETTRLRVPAGNISVNGYLAVDLGGYEYEYTYVGVPEKKLTKDSTIELDATKAVEITVTGDRDLAVGGATLAYSRIADDYWYVGGAVYSGADARMFAVPVKKKVKNGHFGFGSYWRMYEPGVATADSSYVYNLAFPETGRVSAEQDHRVTDRSLAKVDEHWYAQGVDQTYIDVTTALDPVTGENIGTGNGDNTVDTPTDRTAYYTPGIGWTQLASSGRMMVETYIDPVRTYKAGKTYEVDWYRNPSPTGMFYNADGTPARIGERQNNLMGFGFAQWKDSEPGRSGVGGFGDLGNMRLVENGVDLGTSAWPSGQWEVSGDPARYEATVTQVRMPTSWNKAWKVGTGTQTTFGFDSHRPDGDTPAALPLLVPSYTMDVDRYNAAPAKNGFVIAVDFLNQDGHDPAPITSVSAQISTDDIQILGGDTPLPDYEWTDVTVKKKAGTWYIFVDNTAFTGTYPSLHLSATDADGNTVDQYTLNLYAVA